jgi:ADP-heptose:LPS heptosyltransferase
MLYLLITYLCAPFIYLYHLLRPRHKGQKTILVVQTAKIGDMVCATPVIEALKKADPEAKMVVMSLSLTAPLLQANPYVDQVVTVDMKAFRGALGRWRCLQQIGKVGADTVIFLNPNLTFLLVSFWLGIRERLVVLPAFMGKTMRLASHLMSHVEVEHKGELLHTVQQRLLAKIDVPMKSFLHTAYAQEECPLTLDKTKIWIGLAVSSGNKLKELGLEKLVALAEQLSILGSVALIGSADDTKLAQQVMDQADSTTLLDTTGKCSLAQLPAFLAQLNVYIGVDSGITYMADAVGTPVVTIMGPADPREQRPMGEKVIVIQQKEPCAPCAFVFKAPYSCWVGTRACIQKVMPAYIVAQVKSLLK